MKGTGTMNITQASEKSGLSVDTIRFYEKSAMLPKLTRDKRGWRAFDVPAIDWLVTLERLRATGMPLQDIKRFATLANGVGSQSKAAAKERLQILERHQERLKQRRVALDACEVFLKFKINIYRKQVKS
jgi:MerR family transcriptional regulator, aldehyde-responsive regulator